MAINNEETFNRALAHFKLRPDVIEENKRDILKFLVVMQANNRGVNRRIKYLRNLTTLSKLLGKPFEDCTREDVMQLVTSPAFLKLAKNTQRDFKLIFRKFVSWLRGCAKREYAPEVSWLEGFSAVRRDLTREQLLDEKDISLMLAKATNPRDRAIILTLFYSGIRASELLGLKVKDFYQDNGLWALRVEGSKTPSANRRIPIIDEETLRALREWLGSRPSPDGESWLWTDRAGKVLEHRTLLKTLGRIGGKAGITKPLNPHSFRHAWATRLANDKNITNSQFCYLGGWSQSSREPLTYLHTAQKDVFEAFSRIKGQQDGAETKASILVQELLLKAFQNEDVLKVVLDEMRKHEALYNQLKTSVFSGDILFYAPNGQSKKCRTKRHYNKVSDKEGKID